MADVQILILMLICLTRIASHHIILILFSSIIVNNTSNIVSMGNSAFVSTPCQAGKSPSFQMKIDPLSQIDLNIQQDVDSVNLQLDSVVKNKNFSILNTNPKQYFCFQKLYQPEIQEDSENTEIKKQLSNCSPKGVTREDSLLDYICFKKYSPAHHYDFIKLISSSKNSKVYLAQSKIKNNFKAIKVMRNFNNKKQVTERKSKNIKDVLSFLDHPHIIRFYEVYQYKNRDIFLMEYLDGGSFNSWAGSWRWHKLTGLKIQDYFDKLRIVTKQILCALCYLHQNKVAHLNISGKNVLLCDKMQSKQKIFAKLVGFGSAMKNTPVGVTEQFIESKLRKKLLIPPQIIHLKQVSTKSDVWSLGIMLFQIITKVKISKIPFKITTSGQYFNIKAYIVQKWIKMENEMNIEQKFCLELILNMIQSDVNKRFSAHQCLQSPWFIKLDLERCDFRQQIKQNTKKAFLQSISTQKTNNLINYIENLIVYKNISQKELSHISQTFLELDKDKDGSVAIQQLIEYFTGSINNLNEKNNNIFEFCLELMSQLDKNNSGSIDYIEFSKALGNTRRLIRKEAIEEIFYHIDGDGNGQITIEELASSLRGCNVTELQYYMKRIDKNFDGTITREQFLKYCLQKLEAKYEKSEKTEKIEKIEKT